MDTNISDNKKINAIIYLNYLNAFMFITAYVLTTILPIFNVEVLELIVFLMDVLLPWCVYFTYLLLLISFVGLIYAIKKDEDDTVKSILVICLLIQPLFSFLFGFKL